MFTINHKYNKSLELWIHYYHIVGKKYLFKRLEVNCTKCIYKYYYTYHLHSMHRETLFFPNIFLFQE